MGEVGGWRAAIQDKKVADNVGLSEGGVGRVELCQYCRTPGVLLKTHPGM